MTDNLKHFLFGLRFRTKITLGMAAMLILSCTIIGLTLSNMASTALLEEGKKRGRALSSGLAFRLAEPILATDFLQMKNLIDNVHNRYVDVVYVFLMDTEGNVLSHTFSGGFPTDLLQVNMDPSEPQPMLLSTEEASIYDCAFPVLLGDRNLGTVRLGLSRDHLEILIQRQRWTALLTTLGVVGLGLVLSSWFATTVTRRLNKLLWSAEEVVQGNLDVQTSSEHSRHCWEIMQCDKEDCPAYGDTRRRCWHLPGTLCEDCRNIGHRQKIENCRKCRVYKHLVGDEIQDLSEAFDVMALTVKNHINELVEREKTIVQQQGLLKTIMNVTPDFITLQGRDLSYQFASKAFCDYFDIKEEEILGKTDFDIFPAEQADNNYHEDRQILSTGRPFSKEISLSRKDRQVWMHVLKVPVYDQEENIIGLLLTARDITMLKKYQEQLIQSQKMEDLGRLAGGVAHEINTPLGIILGYTQLLLEEVENQDWAEDLKTIEKQTKICRKIVADLLGFSRYSQSTTQPVDMNRSLEEVIKLVEHVLSLSHIRIFKSLDPNIPPLVGDQERLKQVWLNLINNAADAVGQDGIIYVKSKLCAHRQKIIISIADTGDGIEEEALSKIFDPFFTTKSVGLGTGLGLSVSFGIIKDHGGDVSALSPPPVEYLPEDFPRSSSYGPGSVFIVELPLEGKTPEKEEKDGSHCST